MRTQSTIAALVLTLLSGCGGLDVKRITGKVLVEGEPIPKVVVTFFPKTDIHQGTICAGTTNDDGEFVEVPDAKWSLGKSGTYGVVLNDPRVNVGTIMMWLMSGGAKIPVEGPPLIPLRYNMIEYTPLEVTLACGVNDLGAFDLQDEDNSAVVQEMKKRRNTSQ